VATSATRCASGLTMGRVIDNTEPMGQRGMASNFAYGDGTVAGDWNMYLESNRK
jgi:hypothetical protein